MNITDLMNSLEMLLWSGWTSLLDYLAANVLLCLVPAFVIAGYMSAMIPKEVITRFLGPKAPRWVSYHAAAAGGFILAVCSCTILPLFAGIWKRGAGLGVAITFSRPHSIFLGRTASASNSRTAFCQPTNTACATIA